METVVGVSVHFMDFFLEFITILIFVLDLSIGKKSLFGKKSPEIVKMTGKSFKSSHPRSVESTFLILHLRHFYIS